MPAVVRLSDWNLVTAIEMQRSKEERAAAKEWAQIDDLVRLCEAARSFSDSQRLSPSHAYGWNAVSDVPRLWAALDKGEKGSGFSGQNPGGGTTTRGVALGARVVAIFGQTQGSQRVPSRQGGRGMWGEAL